RDHAARFRILVQAVEALPQPLGNRSTATVREPQQLRESSDGKYSRHDGDARSRATVAVPQKHVRIEEELRDGADRPRIDFALQILQIRIDSSRLRMPLGIG